MAPPPEYDKEPKAPDKSVANVICDDPKTAHNSIHEQNSLDSNSSNSASNVESEGVETLDESQLKALLDEVYTYKCPKDRENKSNLFKELLEVVEQDEQAHEAAARDRRRAGGVGGGGGGGSLQDLVAALAGETQPRRRHHQPVSARTIHGGSLPSGVDTSFLLGEESRGVEYVATVHCENPAPLAERRVSTSDAHADDNRRSKSTLGMTYTARATLEIGRALTTTAPSAPTVTAPLVPAQVDSGIPFSCISSPEVVTSCNTTSSSPQSAVAVDVKPSKLVGNFNTLPLTRPSNYGSTGTTTNDENKKSLDENGNSVQGLNSPLSGSSQHNKKPRRKKSSKNETVIQSHQIGGYQGNKDLNEVLRFIESNEEQNRSGKLSRVHSKHEDDKGKKRRKDKEKLKRASSLEEVSRTTIEELTEPAPAAPDRRSWGDHATYLRPTGKKGEPEQHSDTALELDFQTVTKKRKQRRPVVPPVVPAPAPPSERSDSNDDMETPRAPASYADIARHNIPDLIESCNYYADEPPPPPPPHYDDSYPALEARRNTRVIPSTGGINNKETAPPDVVGARRPAVVLLGGVGTRDAADVTFGFAVNEQLLRPRRCDLVRSALAGLTYVPPPPPPQHLHLVHYVANAWEDIIKCGSGKVRYYSE